MEVKVVCRKVIKPSTPTPHHLSQFRIGFTDEMSPSVNVPIILYYYANKNFSNKLADNDDDQEEITTNNIKLQSLETSLADILPQFYPLAGRYNKKNCVIDCRDQGVHYVQAQVLNCNLHQLLILLAGGEDHDQMKLIDDLLPCSFAAAEEVIDPLMSIQVNTFECGGIAIGVCISHRIADASTLGTFLLAWANRCSRPWPEEAGNEKMISPVFNSPDYFPGRNLSKLELQLNDNVPQTDFKISTKRFVFDGRAISKIRSKVVCLMDRQNGKVCDSRQQHYYTRVQLVSGLFIKALVGLDRAKYGRSRASLITQTVNFRNKTSPPIPEHSCGNFCIFAEANCTAEESETSGLYDTVNLIGKVIRKAVADCAKILDSREDGIMVVIDSIKRVTEKIYSSVVGDVNVIIISSWCRFPFYEADFGWGKPIWISPPSMPAPNSLMLMDTKEGDGVEVWLNLEEKDMLIFQQDEDIINFKATGLC